MASSTITRPTKSNGKEPVVVPKNHETQSFHEARRNPLALDAKAAAASIDGLNQLLADTISIRDLYKKHHWQASGPTFYMIHLLFDKHYTEQAELVDLIAERVMTLGGVAVAMAADVAEMTSIPRPPRDREDTETQFARLLQAHEIILQQTRALAKSADEAGDDGTNDLAVSNVLRTNELQVWFLVEHTRKAGKL